MCLRPLRLYYRKQGETSIMLYTWFSQFSIVLLNGTGYCENAENDTAAALAYRRPQHFEKT
jgi:hypothetical protein